MGIVLFYIVYIFYFIFPIKWENKKYKICILYTAHIPTHTVLHTSSQQHPADYRPAEKERNSRKMYVPPSGVHSQPHTFTVAELRQIWVDWGWCCSFLFSVYSFSLLSAVPALHLLHFSALKIVLHLGHSSTCHQQNHYYNHHHLLLLLLLLDDHYSIILSLSLEWFEEEQEEEQEKKHDE